MRAASLCGLFPLFACGPDLPEAQPRAEICSEILRPMAPAPEARLTLKTPPGHEDAKEPPLLDPAQAVSLVVTGRPSEARLLVRGPIRSAQDTGLATDLGKAADGAWQFTTPLVPGTYDIALATGTEDRTIGSFEVTVVPVVLCAAEELEPSGQLRFAWRGSGLPDRRVRLFDPVLNTVVREQADNARPFEIGRAMFVTPDTPGLYHLQLVNDGHVDITMDVLLWLPRREPVLRASEIVVAGQDFEVQWIGKPLPGHVFRLIGEGGRALSEAVPKQTKYGPQRARFRAPRSPGSFLLQYVDQESGRDAGRVPISVQSPAL